jgi:tetratricopeptide (TPR) repeat protein
VLYNRGDGAAAEQLERALAIRQEILEPDHLDIANTLEQLGRVHVDALRFDEARPLLERAIEIRRRKQGPEHLELAFALATLGELQLRQHDTKAAERSFREAKLMAEAASPEHAFVAYAQTWLGETLMTQARWDEGEAELREALSRMEAVRGPDHVEIMGPLLGLAGTAIERGRPADALPLAERALAVGTEAKLSDARIATARWLTGQALWDAGGDRDRARALVEQAVAARQVETNDSERLAAAEAWLATHPR